MRICHITPSPPCGQTADALLPYQLGRWSAAAGDDVAYVTEAPESASGDRPRSLHGFGGDVTWVPAAQGADGVARVLPIHAARRAGAALAALLPAVRRADVVHAHGDGLLAGVGALAARRVGRPVVLTLYGPELWQYEPARWRPDLFARSYRRAAHVTFYSHGLLNRATELGLGRRDAGVVYPAVADVFVHHDIEAQKAARAALGVRSRHLLVNVKSLQPSSGQRDLLEALGEVVRTHPDTRLVMCGTGPLREELTGIAKGYGVEGHVTFTGVVDHAAVARYDAAADAFVLPSLLEACPTGAIEALASGTPVIAADSAGGLELRELFGFDVWIVPRRQPMALAQAILELLDDKRRTRWSTAELIERDFRAPSVLAQYRAIYDQVAGGATS